jgi:hypothetical protein
MGKIFLRCICSVAISSLSVVLINLGALAVEIYADFSLMKPTENELADKVRVALLSISQTILVPMRWLGGYGFNHFVMMCLIEGLIVAVLIYGYFFHLRRTRIVSSDTP